MFDVSSFTHYSINEYTPKGFVTCFEMGECETCGGPVSLPNSVHIGKDILYTHPMIRYDGVIPEGYYDEETDMEVCSECC